MIRPLLTAAVALALAGCVAPRDEEETSPTLVSDGREIAESQCAGCHAVGAHGESPNPAAPTFRTVLSQYRPEVLEEELISGIQVAHPMPEFQFNPQGADALIAYLQSIQIGVSEPR